MTAKNKGAGCENTMEEAKNDVTLDIQRRFFIKLSRSLEKKKRLTVRLKRWFTAILVSLVITAILPVLLISAKKSGRSVLAVLTSVSAVVLLFSGGGFIRDAKLFSSLTKDIKWLEDEIEFLDDRQ